MTISYLLGKLLVFLFLALLWTLKKQSDQSLSLPFGLGLLLYTIGGYGIYASIESAKLKAGPGLLIERIGWGPGLTVAFLLFLGFIAVMKTFAPDEDLVMFVFEKLLIFLFTFPFAGIGLIRDLNIALDRSKSVVVEGTLTTKTVQEQFTAKDHKRYETYEVRYVIKHQEQVHHLFWDVPRHVYQQLKKKETCQFVVKEGAFGYLWMESNNFRFRQE